MSDQQDKVIVLCPGQGAQHVSMGKAWVERSDVAARTFAEANDVLGFDLRRLCLEGPEDQLNRTDNAQPAIYVAAVACYRAWREAGAGPEVVATAGLSLGEFTALHLAGAFDFASGLRLVRLRGQAMQAAAEAVPSGMVAVIGADEEQANELCDRARGGEVLVPANFNCPGQVVISGSKAACERALRAADALGLGATPLAVAGAFHSPIMAPAAERLAAALDETNWSPPVIPVVSNVTGTGHEADVASIKRRLVEQLTHPVRWAEGIAWLLANVQGEFVELAPGRVLSGLMRRIDRKIKVTNLAEPKS